MAEQVTDATFESVVLKSDLPVLLDFWAPWCGPCRAVGPIIDELSTEYAGKVRIVKMNVDENPATPTKFGIRAIPTLVLFKNGETIEQDGEDTDEEEDSRHDGETNDRALLVGSNYSLNLGVHRIAPFDFVLSATRTSVSEGTLPSTE